MKSRIATILALATVQLACGGPPDTIGFPGKQLPFKVVCGDIDSCGTQGENAQFPAPDAPLVIAKPEHLLGTRLPERRIYTSPNVCGGYISDKQYTTGSASNVAVTFDDKSKSDVSAGIKANLKGQLSSVVSASGDVDSSINKAVDEALSGNVDVVKVVYSLDPIAVGDRKKACGNNKETVRSIAVVEMSGTAKSTVAKTIADKLKANAALKAAAIGAADATFDGKLDQASNIAATTSAQNYKVVVAVGFDNR